MESLTRRKLLHKMIFGIIITMSGCLSTLSRDEPEHTVRAINRSERDREVQITIYADDDRILFEENYDLEAGTRSTDDSFTGYPSSMNVTSDNNEVEILIVPAEQCQNDSPLVLAAFIDYEGELEPSYHCRYTES